MNAINIIDRARACLLGVAIGDALGLPVETLSRAKILEKTDGKGISGFVDPINDRTWTTGIKAGDTSDDWQLTRTVAKSLIRSRGKFDQYDCANAHVEELDTTTFGWGTTTTKSIRDIKEGNRIIGKDAYPHPIEGKGSGNGVMMKVAPLAINHAWTKRDLFGRWHDVKALGLITHPDIKATVCAFALSQVLDPILNTGLSQAMTESLMEVWQDIVRVQDFELIDTEVSDCFLSAVRQQKGDEELKGCGFTAIETLGFVIRTFATHAHDFRAGVLYAVNAGGDTDTSASIVGALIGANVGIEGIPAEWRNFNPSFAEAYTIGEQLCF